MYRLESLLGSTAEQRGPLVKVIGEDAATGYAKVWDAFNGYIADVIEEKKTLSITGIMKIGWREEKLAQGRSQLRPHFELSDTFCRANNIEGRSCAPAPDAELAGQEELSFSKAAIRYSQDLTKDNLFTGLKAIFKTLGEALGDGRPAHIDFEVGVLHCQDREIHFEFHPELYLNEGLPLPASRRDAEDYERSVTFAPPSEANMEHLQLHGAGYAPSMPSVPSEASESMVQEMLPLPMPAPGGRRMSSTPRPPIAQEAPASRSELDKMEQAHLEALHRHISKLEADASLVVAEKEQWEAHLARCLGEEEKDLRWRRAIAKDNAQQVWEQIQLNEEKRKHRAAAESQTAGTQDFPHFAEIPEGEKKSAMREQQGHLREALEQQVKAKEEVKKQEKAMDLQVDCCHVDATHKEIAELRDHAANKKAQERAVLAEAWDRDRRMRDIKKAINNYQWTSKKGGDLQRLMKPPAADAGVPAAGKPVQVPAPGPEVPMLALQPPPSGDSRPPPTGSSSSRLSGSARRTPLGAAASLALHKQKAAKRM